MGLSPSTTSLVCLPCAISRAQTAPTTTLLRSLEGLGGAFDVPKAKCPPDRGSSDCVTGSPASSILSRYSSPFSSPSCSPRSDFNPGSSPPTNSRTQPTTIRRSVSYWTNSNHSTPPLTPDDGSHFSKHSDNPPNDPVQEKDALDFLITVFPRQGLSALPFAKSVSISAPNLGSDFNGVVLNLPGSLKTLYVDGKSAEFVSLRESVVALLDLADENLECSSLIIVLERSSPNLGALLHSLMYVGGAVVTKPPFEVDPAFVLVGLEV